MKLAIIEITGFKRFHKLFIEDLPATARLVVMTGPNGSGKSSLFDAFATWYGHQRDWGGIEAAYHQKTGFSLTWDQSVKLHFHDQLPTDPIERKKTFYIRSAYRNEPDFNLSSFQLSTSVLDDGKRVRKLIDNDVHVSDNYQRLIGETVSGLYSTDFDAKTVKELRESLIGQVRDSMFRVFDALTLTGTGNPIVDGTFFFEKGASKNFRYKNLSGGEKAAFDILLDFIIKRTSYNNTIFCIDEPEAHINTRLQGKLLEELYSLTPENCQLWISTHSIGMMRAAKKLKSLSPETVAFIDFDNQDFDKECRIVTTTPNRAFWLNALKVALDDLAGLVAPAQVVLCEGRPRSDGTRSDKAEFDADCYRIIFAEEYPETDFISVGNADSVQSDKLQTGKTIQTLVTGTEIIRVIDRDARNALEVAELEAEGIRVLSLRHLEAYLYDDEILTALCESTENPDKVQEILSAKAQAMSDSVGRNNPSDDVKSASGEIYNSIKRILNLTASGSNSNAFCKMTLAPLVQPGTATYDKLRKEIFG